MLKIAHAAEEHAGAGLMAWWGGLGAARVLAREDDALLMERAMGPRSLAAMARAGEDDDDEACRILCRTIALLHAPRPSPSPNLVPLDRWFEALLEGHSRFGALASRCADEACALLGEARATVVLHGDIHHGNVLDFAARGWLAIDPKALTGERHFDFANLFRNPDVATATAGGRLERRLAIVCVAGELERRRLLRWILALAGLSSIWLRCDGERADADLRIMEIAAAALDRP